MQTDLARRLGIEFPIFAFTHCRDVVAAVSKAGGFGVLTVIGYLGLILSPLGGTVLWVCALGIGVSTFPLCMTLINRRTRTPESASAGSGFVQGIGYGLA